jgi:hypothetical protein
MRIVLVFALLGTACGGGNSGGTTDSGFPDAPVDPAHRYEPWVVGAKWAYKLTDPKNASNVALNRMTTIEPMQDAGNGKQAYLVHIEKLTGTKDVWETIDGDLDVRYKTVFFDNPQTPTTPTETDTDSPYRLKLDESLAHVTTGAMYQESFNETATKPGGQPSTKQKTYTWTVVSDSESVTVPAGTYSCLHVQRNDGSGPQDYWYARGVGKIKETGGGQIEELMSYTPGT